MLSRDFGFSEAPLFADGKDDIPEFVSTTLCY